MTTQDILGITVLILALFFFGERVFNYVKEMLK
ncbi:hypothetical protein F885_03008 [Acinetobacter higginsii]|nr:hypothetical protein F885_03008 [Acinetobacter higginsii]